MLKNFSRKVLILVLPKVQQKESDVITRGQLSLRILLFGPDYPVPDLHGTARQEPQATVWYWPRPMLLVALVA